MSDFVDAQTLEEYATTGAPDDTLEGVRAIDTIQALLRGRATDEHAEQIDIRQVRAYLTDAEEWRPSGREPSIYDGVDGLVFAHDGGRGEIVPASDKVDAWSAGTSIKNIARAEERPELRVWLEIARQEVDDLPTNPTNPT